jgi:Lar family restriction alleviation protein
MKKGLNLKPCPSCGDKVEPYFDFVDSMKWGALKCGCGASGPDVRTNYKNSEHEDWHDDAIKEWNRRA